MFGKFCQPIWIVNLVLHGPAGHQAAGFFGEEADDFVVVLACFFCQRAGRAVFKSTVDDIGLKGFAQGHFGVFDGRQVDDGGGGFGGLQGVQVLGHGVAPKGVQVGAFAGAQGGAHFQPVRLQFVERAQRAVQAREDHDVGVGPGDVGGTQALGVQAVVDVAVESQQGGFVCGGVQVVSPCCVT